MVLRSRKNKIYHDSVYSYEMIDTKISLSIITLSYNQAEFIQENIDSVKNALINVHAGGGVEHIFIDPGSNDNSRAIIDTYSKRYPNVIKIFEPDSGPAEGLNKGLRIARGEWLGILNADDYYKDQSLSKFLKCFPKLNRYDIVYGYGYLLKDESITEVHVGRLDLRNFALGQQQIFQPSIFFRKRLIDRTMTIFNESNRTCWDAEFIFNLIKYGHAKVKRLPIYFAVFRLHQNSISGSQANSVQYQIDMAEIMRRAKIDRNQKKDEIINAFQQNILLLYPKKFIMLIFGFYYKLKFSFFRFKRI